MAASDTRNLLLRQDRYAKDGSYRIGIGFLKEQIEAPGVWLVSLLILQNQVAKPEYRRVLSDAFLDPLFVEIGVSLEEDTFGLDVLEWWYGVSPTQPADVIAERLGSAGRTRLGCNRWFK